MDLILKNDIDYQILPRNHSYLVAEAKFNSSSYILARKAQQSVSAMHQSQMGAIVVH